MSTKITKLLLFVLVSSLFWSCSNNEPKSSYLKEKLTKDNLYDIAQNIKKEGTLSRDYTELFVGAMNRLGLTPDSVLGKTVEQLIKEQENFLKTNSYNILVSTFAKAEILMNQKIQYLGLKALDTNDKSFDYLVFEVTNNSKKDIANLEGQLRFFNNQNQIIKAYPIELNKVLDGKVLKTGETRRFAYPFFHDKTNQRDEIVRTGKDLQVLWFPTTLIYSDSTTITAEIK